MAILKPIKKIEPVVPKASITIHPASPKIAITTMEGIRLIRWQEVLRCHADSNYTRITLKDQAELMICRTLMKIENALPSRYFIRVHKSHLIRTDQIRIIRTHDVLLETGEAIPISKAGRKNLLLRLHDFSSVI